MNLIKKGLALSDSDISSEESKGFTLAEILVVIVIVAIVGTIMVAIFTNTLRGSNKSQILSAIKQNGQAVLENMDKTIRNSDRVVCVINLTAPGPTLVIVKNGVYTRYRFITPTSTANGYFQQETFSLPSSPPSGSDPNLYIRDFETTVCTNPAVSPQVLTDTNTQTGISVNCIASADAPPCIRNPIFKRDRSAGFKDQVTIKFDLRHGVQAPQAVAGQIDPVSFQTTIQLR